MNGNFFYLFAKRNNIVKEGSSCISTLCEGMMYVYIKEDSINKNKTCSTTTYISVRV